MKTIGDDAATSETATNERAKQVFLLVEARRDQLADMGAESTVEN